MYGWHGRFLHWRFLSFWAGWCRRLGSNSNIEPHRLLCMNVKKDHSSWAVVWAGTDYSMTSITAPEVVVLGQISCSRNCWNELKFSARARDMS